MSTQRVDDDAVRFISRERGVAPTKSLRTADPLGSIDDVRFSWPLLTAKRSALLGNAAAMGAYAADAGVHLAPHVKTAMSEDLAKLQAVNGAWAFTVANMNQLRTVLSWGAQRVLIANQIVDSHTISWLRAELVSQPNLDIYLYVDSFDGALALNTHLGEMRERVGVLLELGVRGGRAGCRTTDEAMALARKIASGSDLRIVGVSGYEGSILGTEDRSEIDCVRDFVGDLRRLLTELHENGLVSEQLGPAVISCGGSGHVPTVVDELTRPLPFNARRVIRSGCYIFHDHGFYSRAEPLPGDPSLIPALQLRAQVLSRPEPGLAILDAGRRDVGFDLGMPIPLARLPRDPHGSPAELTGTVIRALNDQHAYLQWTAEEDLDVIVGDIITLGVSHPCTTLDKWQAIPIIDDDDRVVGTLRTTF